MSEWQPIDMAPKKIIRREHGHGYGKRFLAVDENGTVFIAYWWQWMKEPEAGSFRGVDMLGAKVKPTHWMPLPEPPK